MWSTLRMWLRSWWEGSSERFSRWVENGEGFISWDGPESTMDPIPVIPREAWSIVWEGAMRRVAGKKDGHWLAFHDYNRDQGTEAARRYLGESASTEPYANPDGYVG